MLFFYKSINKHTTLSVSNINVFCLRIYSNKVR